MADQLQRSPMPSAVPSMALPPSPGSLCGGAQRAHSRSGGKVRIRAEGATMQIGVFYFPTDYGIQPAELARALEDRGYESVFFCEHTHIPTSRRSPYPGGGELPRCYAHTHDPFIGLAFAAAATSKLRIGTAVCLVP